MTKQDVIKQAWGKHWDRVKNLTNDHGYVVEQVYHSLDVEEINFEFIDVGVFTCKLIYRPKSLSGIEDNNGWIPLDTSVPNIHSSYFVCDIKQKDRIDIFTGNLLALTGDYTHYQPIVKPSKPLY